MKYSYKTQYYRYVMNHIYQFVQHKCLPPYDDTRADFNDASTGASICFNFKNMRRVELNNDISLTPEIFKCFTGITPYKCPELTNDVKIAAYSGFSFPDTSNTDCYYENNDGVPAKYRTNCEKYDN